MLVADFVVLLLGTVGVAALLFIPAFLVADSGALLPLEARLTGRGATLSRGARRGDDALHRQGHARRRMPRTSAATRCATASPRVDGYAARNGYLHGTSPRFDLAAGPATHRRWPLEASRPAGGEHRFRLKLECANDRLAVAEAVLIVR